MLSSRLQVRLSKVNYVGMKITNLIKILTRKMLMQRILLFRVGRSKAHGREIGKQCSGRGSRSLRILHVGRMGYFRSTCSTVSMLYSKMFPAYFFTCFSILCICFESCIFVCTIISRLSLTL